MRTTLLTCTLTLLLPVASPAEDKEPRKANPFAPSLPQLTDEEEEHIDKIIDRFIRYDIGQLEGAEGKKALAEFHKLGPEAIFGLIRGMNKAARIEASCPALVIAKKLAQMLRASQDPQLVEFARTNIGAGVVRSRHMALLQDLRVMCMVRKRTLGRNRITEEKARKDWSLQYLSIAELAESLPAARGTRRKNILAELASRPEEEATNTLAEAAGSKDRELAPLGRTYLVRNLSGLNRSVLADRLRDENKEVRLAAVRAAGNKRLRLAGRLIDMLADESPEVRKAVHKSLLRLSGGKDLGPKNEASPSDQSDAIQKWRSWWSKKSKQ